MLETAYFKYYDSLGAVHSQSFDILSVKGLDAPDNIQLVPDLIYLLMDGSSKTEFRGFRRIVTFELDALNSLEDYLRAFLQASNKAIVYKGGWVQLLRTELVQDNSNFENEWIEGFEHQKKYILELVDKHIYTIFPEPITIVDYMYIKLKVEISQPYETPETFTTNIGKLLTMQNGDDYPPIDLSACDVAIILSSYQGASINQFGDTVQSASDISFQLGYDMAGNPYADGKYYADIIIGVQPKV